ncbi:MAG: hypothetical protein LBG64_04330 [Pseudomonadales bacterium]|jgi:hypothetical protein|nr:hypothetical protein [Pseudomonadales bacterium]
MQEEQLPSSTKIIPERKSSSKPLFIAIIIITLLIGVIAIMKLDESTDCYNQLVTYEEAVDADVEVVNVTSDLRGHQWSQEVVNVTNGINVMDGVLYDNHGHLVNNTSNISILLHNLLGNPVGYYQGAQIIERSGSDYLFGYIYQGVQNTYLLASFESGDWTVVTTLTMGGVANCADLAVAEINPRGWQIDIFNHCI